MPPPVPAGESAVSAGEAAARIANRPEVGPSPPAVPHAPFQFGLASLLLIITLTSIVLSMVRIHPGLGIAAAILAAPALLVTCVLAMRRRDVEKPLTAEAKVRLFFASLGLIVLVLVAVGAAFFVTCSAIFWGGMGLASGPRGGYDVIAVAFIVGLVLGGIAAIAVGVLLIRFLVRRLRRGRR
jgi:hypothetical protein